jgi:hypothetical protein
VACLSGKDAARIWLRTLTTSRPIERLEVRE